MPFAQELSKASYGSKAALSNNVPANVAPEDRKAHRIEFLQNKINQYDPSKAGLVDRHAHQLALAELDELQGKKPGNYVTAKDTLHQAQNDYIDSAEGIEAIRSMPEYGERAAVEPLNLGDVGLSPSAVSGQSTGGGAGQLQDAIAKAQRQEELTRKPQDRRNPNEIAASVALGGTTRAERAANFQQAAQADKKFMNASLAVDRQRARMNIGPLANAKPGSVASQVVNGTWKPNQNFAIGNTPRRLQQTRPTTQTAASVAAPAGGQSSYVTVEQARQRALEGSGGAWRGLSFVPDGMDYGYTMREMGLHPLPPQPTGVINRPPNAGDTTKMTASNNAARNALNALEGQY